MEKIMRIKSVFGIVAFYTFVMALPAFAAEEKMVTIGLIGDSTVADTYGWGPAFATLVTGQVTVLNFAKNGATLDSLSTKLDELIGKKPDYVLIQFGHNDMKRYDATAYGAKLKDYVERVMRAGGKPVVLSSVTRRNFYENGRIASVVMEGDRSLPVFALSAKAVAKEAGVPFIDLNTISIEHHNKLGPEIVAAYNFKESDTTHFSPAGAEVIAGLVVKELKTAVPELAGFLK